MSLIETSPAYSHEVHLYQTLSNAQDAPGLIKSFLAPVCTGLVVLDAGAGSGKYTASLSCVASKVISLDQSSTLAQICRTLVQNTAHASKVEFVLGELSDANTFSSIDQFDICLMSWVLGTITSPSRRVKTVENILDKLSAHGAIYLVENSPSGEFEQRRDRINCPHAASYRNTLVQELKFKHIKNIKTHFLFNSTQEAIHTLSGIWPNMNLEGVSSIVRQDVDIYCLKKE